MTYQSYTPEKEDEFLFSIRDGMTVYDWDDKKVGIVKDVRFPSQSSEEMPVPSMLEDAPDDIQARLVREGYVVVDGGFFFPDRYILPHQILDVSDREVILSALKEDLIRF